MEEFGLQQCDAKVDTPQDFEWQWVTQDGRPFTCLSLSAALEERKARLFYTDGVQYRVVMRTMSSWREH